MSVEKIILEEGRPALIVANGSFEPSPIVWAVLEEHRAKIEKAIPGVGRINVSNVQGLQFAGSCFLVTDDLVMTTRQVAELLATGVGVTGLAIRTERSPEVDFRCGDEESDRVPVVEAVLIHPFLNVALLRIEAARPHKLMLSPVSADECMGRKAVVIGHIAYDPEREISLFATLFGHALGRKHVSPGSINKPRIVGSTGQQMWALTHDCTTLPGSLGGPVIDLETGHVVGIHVVGNPFGENRAIPIGEVARDPRIVNLGLEFDRPVEPSEHAWNEYWARAEADSAAPAAPASVPATKSPALSVDLRMEIASSFPTAEAFQQFLTDNGYEAVLNAVPPSVSLREYQEGVLRALERRDLIDEKFLQALQAATGKKLLLSEEPAGEPPAAKPLGARRRTTRSRSAKAAESAAVKQAVIPENVLNDLREAVKNGDQDTVALIAVGSPWRDWLLRPDGKAGTYPETIERLAHDPAPDALKALTWLVVKMGQIVPATMDRASVDALIRAHAYLTSSAEPSVAPPLEPVWPEDSDLTDVDYLTRGIEAGRAVVLVQAEKTKGQSFYGGTGWLLTPSLVVTPGHLIQGPRDPEPKLSSFAKKLSVRFDFDQHGAEVAAGKNVAVRAIELLDHRLDLAVLRLSEEVTDRAPLQVNPEPPAPGPGFLTMIHHPQLGPKKLSIRGGRLLASDAHQVTYMIATQPGSAGGPVLDMDWRVVATHRAWESYRRTPDSPPLRAKVGTATTALLKVLREMDAGLHPLWREVIAAQRALRTIDPTLYAKLAELERTNPSASVPMVIQVLGESTSLDGVPGLKVGTRDAYTVTATGTRAAIDALAQRSGVLSVKGSFPAGSYECAVSIPHIGADRVHQDLNERGEEALIAIIDNGVDVFHQSFRDEHGRTRVIAFWDQKDLRSPAGEDIGIAQSMSPLGKELVEEYGLQYGALYVADDLQGFIDGKPLPDTFPVAEEMSHGTTVASIAAGRRTGENNEVHFPGGIAPASSLIVVRYDLQDASVGYSDGHIAALIFIDKLAARLNKPVVVNISNGMNAGAHDGTSPVEQQCQVFTGNGGTPGRLIVKSAGNERGKARHAMLKVGNGGIAELRWRSTGTNPGGKTRPEIIELWFAYRNQYRFRVKPPTGGWSPPIYRDPLHSRLDEFLENGNKIDGVMPVFNSENGDGSLHLTIGPGKQPEVQSGDWVLEIKGLAIEDKQPIHAWVEETLNRELYFLDKFDDYVTITIPGTAKDVITVGATEVHEDLKEWINSSWGPDRKGQEKPEVVAPGVDIRAAMAGSGSGVDPESQKKSGTSLAAPHVAGVIALALSARVKTGKKQLNTNQIRPALVTSLRHRSSIWNEATGFGELNAIAFLELVRMM